MGPGGRGEACKLTPCGETRFGGGRSSRDVQLREDSGWRLQAGHWDTAAWRCVAERKPATNGRQPVLALGQTPLRRGAAGPWGLWQALSGGFATDTQGADGL
jgi:hypothetical protein